MVGPFKFLSKFMFTGVRREVQTELRSEKVRRYIVTNPYHAVSVAIPIQGGCQAARAIRETRFLSEEAPTLPLKGCDQQSKCACRYQHHDDRRAGPRRSADVMGTWRNVWHGTEKRRTGGRRVTDT